MLVQLWRRHPANTVVILLHCNIDLTLINTSYPYMIITTALDCISYILNILSPAFESPRLIRSLGFKYPHEYFLAQRRKWREILKYLKPEVVCCNAWVSAESVVTWSWEYITVKRNLSSKTCLVFCTKTEEIFCSENCGSGYS